MSSENGFDPDWVADWRTLRWDAPEGDLTADDAGPTQTHAGAMNGALRPVPGPGNGYVARAVELERAGVLGTVEPGRNNRLHLAAFNLGQLAPAYLDPAELRADLVTWGLAVGLPAGEVGATVDSGMRAGMARPREVELIEIPEPVITEVGWDEFDKAEPNSAHAQSVKVAVEKLRITAEARKLFDAERAPVGPSVEPVSVAWILANEPEPIWRIENMLPAGGSLLVAAMRKTGKTTLLLNLARSMLTGHPFLGRLAVRPVAADATVAFMNFEVAGRQLAQWADQAGIPTERLLLVNVRGRVNPFRHPDMRQLLADQLRAANVETLLVDPFGRAFVGDHNSASEVSEFLGELDAFARELAGAQELILATHTGWDGERTRGSSALEDWPDAIATMTRDTEDESGGAIRYLSAIGRDVELPEDQLAFNSDNRALWLAGAGSRKEAKANRRDEYIESEILAVVSANPGCSVNELGRLLAESGAEIRRADQGRTINRLIERRLVEVEYGPNRSKRLRSVGSRVQP